MILGISENVYCLYSENAKQIEHYINQYKRYIIVILYISQCNKYTQLNKCFIFLISSVIEVEHFKIIHTISVTAKGHVIAF